MQPTRKNANATKMHPHQTQTQTQPTREFRAPKEPHSRRLAAEQELMLRNTGKQNMGNQSSTNKGSGKSSTSMGNTVDDDMSSSNSMGKKVDDKTSKNVIGKGRKSGST